MIKSFRSTKEKLLIADPKILKISIKENNEPIIDLNGQTNIVIDVYNRGNNFDYTKMRKSVYEKLIKAQSLLPNNLKFCLYEGYRSLTLQKELFEERYIQIKNLHNKWNHEEVFIETTKFVSPVINLDGSQNIPPHSTGGAIDVYLVNDSGQMIDMGVTIDNFQDQDGSLYQTDSKIISLDAQKNRQFMNKALSMVGFINYPTEYWHWSFGDRYWAYYTNNEYAIYGSIG